MRFDQNPNGLGQVAGHVAREDLIECAVHLFHPPFFRLSRGDRIALFAWRNTVGRGTRIISMTEQRPREARRPQKNVAVILVPGNNVGSDRRTALARAGQIRTSIPAFGANPYLNIGR
ncbi:hypothetical protein [Methyloraptor flagellatus]|uniref:Uncharacterized protein n=1 Tax=Methyloraptor flagellatus TaxID=3162530 RepID=A0AAU7XHU0_9HYPH